MDNSSLMIAWMMLAAPVGTIELDDIVRENRAALVKICIDQEILDKDNEKYYFKVMADYQTDLDSMRFRLQKSVELPKLSEHERFPDRYYLAEYMAFNRGYHYFLDKQLLMAITNKEHRDIQNVINENNKIYNIYDQIKDSKAEHLGVFYRREKLAEALKTLGEEDFYLGILPPYIPIWRFREEK